MVQSAGRPLAPVPAGIATIVSEYERPCLAHASIAPSCAIAQWDGAGRLEVTSHSQGIYALRKQIARALRVEEAAVTVTHAPSAGCYGHNGADDVALDAALLARGGTAPVMVMWSRADDMTWAPFAAPMRARIEAGLDTAGRIAVWNAEIWSRPHSARPGTGPGLDLLAAADLAEPFEPTAKPGGSGKDRGGDRNAIPLYDLPTAGILYNVLPRGPVRTSALRSLGAHLNTFAIESLMDELAEASGQDPLAFRLAHLDDPRAAAVLRAAAEAAGWDPEEEGGTGEGRGIAVGRYKNVAAWYACVVRVAVEEEVRVISVHGAVDTGRVIQPDGVRNQVEGGVVQSLSMTLKEAVRWDVTGILTRSWADYPVLRFSETPQIETVILDNTEEPLGAGECAAGPVAAAVANAVAHALGLRIRRLPINRDAILAAIHAD
jgi:nicotinate dehydrogenase subunit B